jgi:3'(2'), 5'-bisphosphate nucleotidase
LACQAVIGTEPQMQDDTVFSAGLLDDLTTLVSRAAAVIMTLRAGTLQERTKADRSPVTAADEAAEAVILEGLAGLLPGVPVISEEAGAGSHLVGNAFVLVDPLDGTRELLSGRDEFTINVALVRAGIPVLGIVAAPALALIWRTAGRGIAERLHLAPGSPASTAAQRSPIGTRPFPAKGPVVLVSRSHPDPATDALLGRLPDAQRIACGSSLKFCRLAEGEADLYPRLGPTRQWDVAAGHAVLLAAGGIVVTPDGVPLGYRPQEGFAVPGFVACGDPSAPARLAL